MYACLAGFVPADRVMDLLIVACGLGVMYEIHLKFFVLNEALICLRMGDYELKGQCTPGKRTEVAHTCGHRHTQMGFIVVFFCLIFFY